MWLWQHFKLCASHIPIGPGYCLRHVYLRTLAGKSSQRDNRFPSGAQSTHYPINEPAGSSPNITPESLLLQVTPPTQREIKVRSMVQSPVLTAHFLSGPEDTFPSQTTFFLIGWFRKNRNWVRPTKLRILSYHLKNVWSWASYIASFHVWSNRTILTTARSRAAFGLDKMSLRAQLASQGKGLLLKAPASFNDSPSFPHIPQGVFSKLTTQEGPKLPQKQINGGVPWWSTG